MNAGSLDRHLFITRRVPSATDQYGVLRPGTDEAQIRMRGKLIDNAATDQPHDSGRITRTILSFKIRYLPGLKPGDFLVYDSHNLEIVSIKEVGRRKWLEITATERT